MGVPIFTFAALPVPEILGGTLKKLGSHVTGPHPFLEKIITGICLGYPCEWTYQILHS